MRAIAKCLERAVSTVSREVARQGGRPEYRASPADGEAWPSALRPQRCLLSVNLKLRNIVASKLILDGSPEQISGWLKTPYPDEESLPVSHETMYRSLFIQARGALQKELLEHWRCKRRIRRSQHSRIFKDGRGQIPEAISIRPRPAEVEDRAIPGHGEGDLLRGSGNSHIATLLERHSRFVMLIQVPSRDTAEVVGALSKHVRKLPATLRSKSAGTGDCRWRNTRTLRWPRMCKSTSVIRRVPGNAARTKTQTGSYDNTSRRTQT